MAVDGLDLVVRPGEVYGFLGPNGAGKTTTIRMVLGLHRPTAGSATVFGIDAWRDPVAAHRRLAYGAGEPSLWPQLTAEETLDFLGRVHGSVDADYRRTLVDRFELSSARGSARSPRQPAEGAADRRAGDPGRPARARRADERARPGLPACVLFLGVGAVLVVALPRLGFGVAYALVSVAFVWELFGALLGAPSWLLGVSPFHQIGLVPVAPFRAGPAAAMLAIGAAGAAAALVRFRSRDLAGA